MESIAVVVAPPQIGAVFKSANSPKALKGPNHSWIWRSTASRYGGRVFLKPVAAAPEGLSEKVAESIEQAKSKCSDDPTSGECVAAWDEVEELSAAASHAKARKKDSDPLDDYCKDNPETEECRTYED